MPIGGPQGGVTYLQMVEYVARVTDPMEGQMDAHDVWHLEQLTTAQRADRANRIAMFSVWIASGAFIASIVLGIVFRH